MNAVAPSRTASAALASAYGIDKRCEALVAVMLKARGFVADLQHPADSEARQLLDEIDGALKREPKVPYRGWWIQYDPPPIPVRGMDWQYHHDDFDASWEGEEDGYVGNGLCGHAASLAEAMAEIDERLAADEADATGQAA
jgi:hypothetical protein